MNRLPTLFVSHGAPTYALEPGLAGAQLAAFAARLPRPRAILVVSPHWMTVRPRVATTARPETIHDFGGFPAPLYELQYPAPGHPEFAQRAIDLLNAAGWPAQADPQRGLDHGAWVPLRHLYPQADVPVFQVSLPASLTPESALAYGAALAPLAEEGVLIVGSGSLTHNLYEFRMGQTEVLAYAREFEGWIRDAVVAGDRGRLAAALDEAPHARRAHPTTEHFLPLPVAFGAAQPPLPATVLRGEILYGALSMESYAFGDVPHADTASQACNGASR
ncbi:DODA-type extradiol aromatic ring-opening family dioxygenase [Pseudothauera rhizosphaerae]|uniref:Dioxygenase n=1 Tax=Pseudothauera rhizosphaerae TaxID=2565932 RepID=A0A4S4AR78_9RHOO|nr:class III extradiol ring-cleavage dioxygenase [Pseudothauera rhizosphaerae]THF60956.1 dioxygenase [Pseudothauera rhizosphaerae]